MSRIDIQNDSAIKDEVAVYLVYCWLAKKPTTLFKEHGIEIRHRTNSKVYRVVDKDDSI
ncbi:MAG: hypothetical protein IJT79_08465 [Ruminococcus sp.]|nr:hypothetical protein [Ruminococcus sp.]